MTYTQSICFENKKVPDPIKNVIIIHLVDILNKLIYNTERLEMRQMIELEENKRQLIELEKRVGSIGESL